MAVVTYYFLRLTWGFELRMVGSNPNAARYAGIKISQATIVAMVLSGALAGMAGANEVLGVNFRVLQPFQVDMVLIVLLWHY